MINFINYNHGIINRDNFCQCVRISGIIILVGTVKAYFKFFVLLPPPSPTLQCWLLAKESQEQPRTQHCNGGVGGRGERSANFYLHLRGLTGVGGGGKEWGEGERSANFYLDLRGFLMSQFNCSLIVGPWF